MVISEYDEKKHKVKHTASGWNSDDFADSSEHSSPNTSPIRRSRRASTRTPPYARSHRESHSSMDSVLRTRSILVRGPNYPRDPQKDFSQYFSKFGKVEKVTIVGPHGRKLTFVKFEDYDCVADIIGKLIKFLKNNNNNYYFFCCRLVTPRHWRNPL